jgi:SAM-dependent methyltransferase
MLTQDSIAKPLWKLACPVCHEELRSESNAYSCRSCGKRYSVADGVVRFADNDRFYEERYEPTVVKFMPNERTPWGRFLLYLISMHYLWYIRKYIPAGAQVLDVACGAGMQYLAQRYRMAGLEVSLRSARVMAGVYELSLQAGADAIPLADQSVDAVVSRFFLEHVPVATKLDLIRELKRVLKPGGVLVTLQDCECSNWLWQWAKKDRVLFQKHFVENDGHYGLLYPSENLQLFREAGFEIVRCYGANKTPLVTLSMLEWMQSYRGKAKVANLMFGAAHVVAGNRLSNLLYTSAMTLFDDVVEPLMPLDHARYLLCTCRVP